MIATLDNGETGFQGCSVLEGACCAFGVFDGVHRGHRFLIGKALAAGRELSRPVVIITFSRDPDELFRPHALKKIMSNERRLQVLDSLGAHYVLALPATPGFFSMPPQEFLARVFAQNVPRSLYVGKDFRFGAGAQGELSTLESWGASHGMEVHGCDLLQVGGAPVTATRIRGLLASCDISQANDLLGSTFALEGVIESGRGEGRNMGFRTANISLAQNLFSLGEGVYGAYAVMPDGTRYKAAVSVGGAPSFGERAHANVEAHIIDFDRDIYGQTLRLEFVAFLRPMIVFDSTEKLIETVMGNIAWCKENL